MRMMNASGKPRGSSDRAKTSKSVRLDDRLGFDHKFNKAGFRSEVKRHLYYFYVKCYEQVLRGGEANAVLERREFLKYRRLSESHPLKPLPAGFRNFIETKKIETLSKLFEEQADAAAEIVEPDEDVDIQVNCPGDMEVDEGSAADPGPEDIINSPPLLDGHFLQHVARNQQGNLHGRPPPIPGQHPVSFQQYVSDLKYRASRYPDIWLDVERWEQQGILLIKKLKEREFSEALEVDSRNTRLRSRQEEILAQLREDITAENPQNQLSEPLMEGISPQANYSLANDFGVDVKHGVKNFGTTKPHDDQDASLQIGAVDPLSTGSSLGVLPGQDIAEALKVTPSYTGRLKANQQEIHPQVFVHNMPGDLQYQFSKPMVEGVGPQASHFQISDLWGDKQCGGEYLTTMPHCGGNSTSQIVTVGHSIPAEQSALERTTREPSAENQLYLWNEPVLEMKYLINHDLLIIEIQPGDLRAEKIFILAEKLGGSVEEAGIHVKSIKPQDIKRFYEDVHLFSINCKVTMGLKSVVNLLKKEGPDYSVGDANCWDYALNTTKLLLKECVTRVTSSGAIDEKARLHKEYDNLESTLARKHIFNTWKKLI